jgi:hypothetical protein
MVLWEKVVDFSHPVNTGKIPIPEEFKVFRGFYQKFMEFLEC